MNNRIVKAVLCLFAAIAVAACSCFALAGCYSSSISSISSTFSRQDTRASNIYQQICNGTYRTVELLEVIAYELDTKGVYSSTISSIHSTFSRQDTRSGNIYQQICNGTYRSTELCEVIAYLLDT